MGNIAHHRKALITRVLDGDGASSRQQRRAAFDGGGPEGATPLIEKVTRHAYKISDADIAAAKRAGFTEDQIFELVVCGAIGQANRQLDSALAALAEATGEK